MHRIFFITMLFLVAPCVAHAVCNKGYYLNNGECTNCDIGYYCPDENTKIKCPEDTSDWVAIYTAKGYDVKRLEKTGVSSWGSSEGGAYSTANCHACVYVEISEGAFYIEAAFSGDGYSTNSFKYWYSAAPGYYLAPYNMTSWRNWYYGVKACTNAPEHAHYTGAGTPDDPVKTGGTTDYNDCPWACDDGYGNHDGKCVPLCSAGVRYIRADNGLRINLYQTPYSSPRIAVEYNNAVCYGVLAPGAQSGAINVDVGGTTYHVEN